MFTFVALGRRLQLILPSFILRHLFVIKKDKNSTGDSAGSSRGYGGHIGGRCPRRLWLMSGILLPPNSSFDQGLLLI